MRLVSLIIPAFLASIPGAAYAQSMEVVPVSEAVSLFAEICLQSEGDRDIAVHALTQTGGFSVSGAETSSTIAPHDSKDLAVLIMGGQSGTNCIVNFHKTVDLPVLIEAYQETVSELASELGVSKSDFTETYEYFIYDMPAGQILVRASGSGISMSITYK